MADRIIPLEHISKIRIVAYPLTPSGSQRLKLTLASKEDLFLAVNPKRLNESHYLGMAYFLFAKLVSMKLQLMGRNPRPISRVR